MKFTEYTNNIQSLVSLSKEEVDSYWKEDWEARSWGIVPKFNDMSPEFLRVGFLQKKH